MSIYLCSGGRGDKSHDEICHEGTDCPFCAYMEEKQNEIDELKDQVKKLDEEE